MVISSTKELVQSTVIHIGILNYYICIFGYRIDCI